MEAAACARPAAGRTYARRQPENTALILVRKVSRGRTANDAGVVDQDVHPAQLFGGLGEQFLGNVGLAQI